MLDLGTAWAAPMAGHLLADMGAEVIKVESRARMDGLRLGRPIVGEDVAGGDRGKWPELQPVFHGLNRNKLSVTLNLKRPDAIKLLKDLVARSDAVINNYSPGVMERLGLGYSELRQLNPGIVVVSMPAAGETGPLRDIIAYAPIILALSGLMSAVGYEDGALVGELQSAWSDAVAGLTAAMAAVAALWRRDVTGRGQYVETAQLEATISWLGEAVMDWSMNRRERGPTGNAHPAMAPHGTYPCRGNDQWVSIAVESDDEWRGLCRAAAGVDRPAPAWTRAPRYADGFRRLRHSAEVDAHVAEWTKSRSATEVTELLQRHGVAAFPVMHIGDQFSDPHFQERGSWPQVEHPMVGTEWLYGLAWHLSETPGEVRRHAPLLGEHNEDIIGGLLGMSRQRLDELVRQGAVY